VSLEAAWGVVAVVAIFAVSTTAGFFRPVPQTTYTIPDGKSLRCEFIEKEPR
jgi:hypothetical protein